MARNGYLRLLNPVLWCERNNMIPNVLYRAVIAVMAFFVVGTGLGQTSWEPVASFAFDWDGHKDVRVVLEIPSSWSDPGDFTRIHVLVPGRKSSRLPTKRAG